MGPCQGGFCTFRAAGLVAERQAGGAVAVAEWPATSDRVLVDFLAERFRGTRPIAWGRQLQELWVTAGLYGGVLGLASLVGAANDGDADPVPARTGAPARELERAER
jgi:glycerol-3-phosphate dehydrogenase